MNERLKSWLLENRNTHGLTLLLYELKERARKAERRIVLAARDHRLDEQAVGAFDELEGFRKFLEAPLTQTTDEGRDT